MARTALDALLGRLLFDGVEAELLGGLNFESCTITIEDGYYTITPGIPTTRTISAGTNMTGGGDLSANRTLSLAASLTGITSINGATVAAPVEGTALTDADQTLTIGGGSDYTQSTALTASRTKTLSVSGTPPTTGEVITIKRLTTAAFTMPIVNGGGGGGTLYTFPSGEKRVADFRYDGTNWVLAGHKKLA
jgi:hypothetical protein